VEWTSTPSLFLRDVEPDDLPILYEFQLDEASTRMAAFPARDREAFFAHKAKVLQDSANIAKTIVYDGKVVGEVMSFLDEGLREVGYWIGRDYWGKGIASQALAQLVAELPRPLGAHVVQHNVGSIRVLEKCGFLRIGEAEVSLPTGELVKEYLYRLDS